MVSAVTISSLSSSTLSFSPILNTDSRSSPPQTVSTLVSPLILCCRISNIHRSREIPVRRRRHLRISAIISEDVVPLEANPVENVQEIVSNGSGNVEATVIQTLLTVAFITLSILTIGVIYIAVADFLQKREREKFEKEETAKKKSGKKSDKKRKAVRAGPRGFGQVKKDEDDDFDD